MPLQLTLGATLGATVALALALALAGCTNGVTDGTELAPAEESFVCGVADAAPDSAEARPCPQAGPPSYVVNQP